MLTCTAAHISKCNPTTLFDKGLSYGHMMYSTPPRQSYEGSYNLRWSSFMLR
jgi:hypothetical protein